MAAKKKKIAKIPRGREGGAKPRDASGVKRETLNKRLHPDTIAHLKTLAEDAGLNVTEALEHCILNTKKIPKKGV